MQAKRRTPSKALVKDVRLLGRLLCEAIEASDGKEAREVVEQVRSLSVTGHRRTGPHLTTSSPRFVQPCLPKPSSV